MTSIIYDAPYLACDSGVFYRGHLVDTIPDKIVLIKNEFYVGSTGSLASVYLVRDYLEKTDDWWEVEEFREGFVNLHLAEDDSFEAVIVQKTTCNCWTLDQSGVLLEVCSPIITLGAGAEFASGVLHALHDRGAHMNALSALELLAKVNGFVRPPFHVFDCMQGEKYI